MSAQTFKEWFAIPPSAARIIEALYEARGDIVERGRLLTVSGQTPTGLNTSMKLIRSAMDAGAVVTKPGLGLLMTPVGLADCRRAIADAAERKRVAA